MWWFTMTLGADTGANVRNQSTVKKTWKSQIKDGLFGVFATYFSFYVVNFWFYRLFFSQNASPSLTTRLFSFLMALHGCRTHVFNSVDLLCGLNKFRPSVRLSPPLAGSMVRHSFLFLPAATRMFVGFLSPADLGAPAVFAPTGWGTVAYCGGAEKDSRGAHEAGAGPSEAAEGGAENHPRQGQVQAQALLLPQGHWMNRLPPACPVQLSLLLIIIWPSSSSVEGSLRFGSAEGKAGCVNLLVLGLEEEAAPDCPPRPRRTEDSCLCFFVLFFHFYLHF